MKIPAKRIHLDAVSFKGFASLFFLSILSTLVFSMAVVTPGAGATSAGLTITDGPNGGDCTKIGVWNPATKTCKMTSYGITFIEWTTGIALASDGITLDGNFHQVGLDYWQGNPVVPQEAVLISGRHDVTVKNLVVWTATDTNNTDVSAAQAIHVDHSNGIVLEDNKITGYTAACCGIAGVGIYISGGGSVVRHNTISNNEVGLIAEGMLPGRGETKNEVYRNNFIDNRVQAIGGLLTAFTDDTLGGNYWSDFDSANEGCVDNNLDRQCDSPYPYGQNVVDTKPWTKPNNWNFLSINGHASQTAVAKIPDIVWPAGVMAKPAFPPKPQWPTDILP